MKVALASTLALWIASCVSAVSLRNEENRGLQKVTTTIPDLTGATDDSDTILTEDFESPDWVNFNISGTGKGALSTRQAHNGEQSARINDKQHIVTGWLRVREYSSVKIDFWYFALGKNETFVTEYKVKGAKSAKGVKDVNEWIVIRSEPEPEPAINMKEWTEKTVEINDISDMNKIRFRIRNIGDGKTNKAFIDDVKLIGEKKDENNELFIEPTDNPATDAPKQREPTQEPVNPGLGTPEAPVAPVTTATAISDTPPEETTSPVTPAPIETTSPVTPAPIETTSPVTPVTPAPIETTAPVTPVTPAPIETAAPVGQPTNAPQGIPETCADCCTSIDALGFIDTQQCNHHYIRVEIINAIADTNCPHDHNVEARKLVGIQNIGEALDELVVKCKEQIQACVNMEDLDFANMVECQNSHWVREEIRNKQTGCSAERQDWEEAMVMTNKPDWAQAEAVLREKCYDLITPCVDYSELVEDFKVIAQCHSNYIRNDIQERIGGNCKRSREQEAVVIVWNLEKGTNPDRKIVWHDADETTTDASAYLEAKCQEKITPCTTVDELDFVNIRHCHEHWIKEEIRKKQEGCDSTRADWQEAMLITNNAEWNDARYFLEDLCYDKISPCVEYTQLEEDFITVEECRGHSVINEVQKRIGENPECPIRSREEEAVVIVWNLEKATNPDSKVVWHDNDETTTDASAYLEAKCQEKITPCVENIDELFDLFATVMLCDDNRVLQEISSLQGEDCRRQNYQDAILLAPEEYKVWRDNNEETQDAADYMHEQCVERITSCAPLDELFTLFESIPHCHEWQIRSDIDSIKGDECRRNSYWDGILLAKEQVLRENDAATEFPTHWKHNDPNVWTAYSVLEEKCRSTIQPCVNKDDVHLGFSTVQYCDQHRIRQEIEIHQPEGCRRNAHDDALLITPDEYAIWGDNNVDTQDARIRLMNECSQRAQPSFQLSQLESDFVNIDGCWWNSIVKKIQERQSDIDSTRRDGNQDAIWLAGEILKAADANVLVTTEIGFAAELELENPDATFALMSFGNQEGTYNPVTMLEAHCKEGIQSCVEDLESFDTSLKDIRFCHHNYILNLITAQQKDSCARAHHQDAPLIARDYELSANPDDEPPAFVWGGNVLELNAAEYLITKCLEKIETCIPSLDQLDMTEINKCDHGHIRNLIQEIQKEDCERTPEEDAILIVRDLEWAENSSGPRPALRPWHHNNQTVPSASNYLIDLCRSGNAQSCVPSYADLNFEDLRLCHEHWIRVEITEKQPETCSRHYHQDGVFLVRAKLEQENVVTPVYEWRDNNPDTIDAYDYMMEDCSNRITACSTVDELDFKNIEFCDEHWIKNEISAKQEGCSATDRPAHEDAIVMTGADTWHDNNPDTTDAREILIGKCQDEITPCVDIETLDFSDIRNCDVHHIRLLIDETREAMGDACPSYETRAWNFEAILATGADTWSDNNDETIDAEDILIAKCMTKVKSCTLKNDEVFEVNGCDWISFQGAVKRGTHEDDCRRHLEFELYALNRELEELTGSTTKELLDATCISAWSTIDTSSFDQVDSEFTNDFMHEYTDGLTHLNKNTGNFRGNGVDDRDGEIGTNIANFRMYEAQKTMVQGFEPLDTCDGQAIMCCFGRDRQFGDNNGNCKIDSCEDADPADNSNLCKTETRAYPNNDSPENEIHCHGLAWGEDVNDFTRKLAFNNFFFVSLYDHMYSRGYAERTIRREDDPAEFRMCDCVEKMPPVTRADCTEVTIDPFIVSRSADGGLLATGPDSLDVQFNGCRGDGRNNDLSTYIRRLVREGRFSEALQSQAYETLVGYENPNDNANEAACQAIL